MVKVYSWYGNETIPTVSYFKTRQLAEEFVNANSRTGHHYEIKEVKND